MRTAEWPIWLYKGRQARLFAVGDDLPAGWHDRPGIDPLDHDGDGKPGGSLKGEQSTVAKGRRKRSRA